MGDIEESHITCLQLVTSVELLTSHVDLWCSSFNMTVESSVVSNLTDSLHSTLTQTVSELLKLLQVPLDCSVYKKINNMFHRHFFQKKIRQGAFLF